jgi:hypothetical protein
MLRQNFKKLIEEELIQKAVIIEKEIELRGSMNSMVIEDMLLGTVIRDAGMPIMLKLIDYIAEKSAAYAEMYIDPKIFEDTQTVLFDSGADGNEQISTAFYYFHRNVYPIDFHQGLIAMAQSLKSESVRQDSSMQGIKLRFVERKDREPAAIQILFGQQKPAGMPQPE